MLDFFLRERDLREITTITVFTPGKVLFDDVGPRMHEKVGSVIAKKEIKVITEKVLKTIEEKSVIFEEGLIATDVVADRSRALLAGPDLNACGYTDNPALALHIFPVFF